MAHLKLPPEIWAQVFDNIRSPSHLLSVSKTCRQFHFLAIRPLHRHLIYTHPLAFLANLSFWPTRPADPHGLRLVPKSLVLGISYMNDDVFNLPEDPSIAQVEADGSITYGQGNTHAEDDNDLAIALPRPSQYYASVALYNLVATHVSQFTALTELVFYNAHLPPLVYSLLKSFPLLESLFFYDCFLPTKTGDLTSLDVLPSAPIKRLALWNVRNEVDHIAHSAASLRYALRLVTIPTLRVLQVDWTGDSAVYLNSLNNGSLPPVTDLAIRMPAQYAWPADLTTARTRLINPLKLFLTSLPSVTRLSIANRLPYCSLPTHALPHLIVYSGAHTSVLDMARYRNLLHVEFRDEDRKSLDVISLLPALKGAAPGLLSLSLPLKKWDEEIMYPTTGFFPCLRRLKIIYEEGYPSEYSILSLGARFLLNLPHLHTFQLYNSLYASNYTPSYIINNNPHTSNSNSSARPHFFMPYTYGSQPTCTNFEEMAFPPSETLTYVHRLTKTQQHTQVAGPVRWPLGGQPAGHHTHRVWHGYGRAKNGREYGFGFGCGFGYGGGRGEDATEWGSLGPQAGPWDEVLGYLAAWRKHCTKLRRVQFVKGFMWRRLDEDMPWVEAGASEEESHGVSVV